MSAEQRMSIIYPKTLTDEPTASERAMLLHLAKARAWIVLKKLPSSEIEHGHALRCARLSLTRQA